MANVPEYALFTVVGCASVTITLNASGEFDTSDKDVVYENVFVVKETPAYSWVATIALVIELTTIQLYVYEEVPPDTVAVHDTAAPDVTEAGEGHEDSETVGETYDPPPPDEPRELEVDAFAVSVPIWLT